MRPTLQMPSMRRFQLHRDLALLLLLVTACAIPFLSQPFHMDDNFYMDMARNARETPLHPNDMPYVFEGNYLPDMGSHSHPPLQTYFLALMQVLAGEEEGVEWAYHLAALTFPIMAVVAFYFVAMRFLERPVWPPALLACSPLFLVMQHNLMADLPTLAFWLAAIACFVWGERLNRGRLYALSAVFQFAAMFTSYQSVALTPLLAFHQIRTRGWRAAGRSGWLALAAPLLAMAGWFLLGYLHYGRFLLEDTLGYVQSRDAAGWTTLGTKLVALLQSQGWVILFPFFAIYVLGRDLRWRALALATLAGLAATQLIVPGYRLVDQGIFLAGAVTGFFVTLGMARLLYRSLKRMGSVASSFERPDAQFIGLWYFGVALYCLVLFTEGSARYILPLIPPVLLCFFRELEVTEVSEYRRERPWLLSPAMVASGSLVLSLGWGMALAHADREFAAVYPQAARDFSRISRDLPSFYAGEWGFRYYFGTAGAEQIPLDESRVPGGSFIARPRLALPYHIPATLLSMTMPVQTLSYAPRTPLRLLDWQTPAGFYSTGWGLIPFSVSRSSLEIVEVRQVNFMVERLPWARVSGASSEAPWPGFLPLQGRSPLAVLLRTGTSIEYDWESRAPLHMTVEVGVHPESYREGIDDSFDFAISQVDADGRALAEARRSLRPGTEAADRGWQVLEIPLRSSPDGRTAIRLRYDSSSKGDAPGAIAGARLQSAR